MATKKQEKQQQVNWMIYRLKGCVISPYTPYTPYTPYKVFLSQELMLAIDKFNEARENLILVLKKEHLK